MSTMGLRQVKNQFFSSWHLRLDRFLQRACTATAPRRCPGRITGRHQALLHGAFYLHLQRYTGHLYHLLKSRGQWRPTTPRPNLSPSSPHGRTNQTHDLPLCPGNVVGTRTLPTGPQLGLHNVRTATKDVAADAAPRAQPVDDNLAPIPQQTVTVTSRTMVQVSPWRKRGLPPVALLYSSRNRRHRIWRCPCLPMTMAEYVASWMHTVLQ